MKIYKQKIKIESKNQMEFLNITGEVQKVVDSSGIREGQVLIFSQHTTLGVAINHNEPMLIQDFTRLLYKLAPADERYSHDLFELRRGNLADGRSNGHSHCKSLFVGVSSTVPLDRGKLVLSERQSIFIVEFDGARKRDAIIQVMGL